MAGAYVVADQSVISNFSRPIRYAFGHLCEKRDRQYERDGFLHLNAAGASVMARKINQVIMEQGGSEIIEDFWEQSLKYRRW